MSGLFLVLEGLDGSGKTTAAGRIADYFRGLGYEVIETREPGGTSLGERIRKLLLEPGEGGMLPQTEALLFAAARAQHVGELIVPALRRGAVVVCDRFVDSSLAYQGGGRGLGFAQIRELQHLATGGVEPDLKLFFDVTPDQALIRRQSDGDINRLDRERLDFYKRVADAYRTLAFQEPGVWRTIDASRTPEEVWQDVRRQLKQMSLPRTGKAVNMEIERASR